VLHKAFPASVKAAGPGDGLRDGEYRALVSVFGTVDAYGDVVLPGAFTDTLTEWKASGDPIPVWWSHRLDDPDYNIGDVVDAEEAEHGLEAHVRLDLEAPKARQVYRLLLARRVTQHSFTYDILDADWGQLNGAEVYQLRKLKLHELGPTPIGANPDTDLLAVKNATHHLAGLAARVKAGRVLSAKNETTLRQARDQLATAVDRIDDVLSALEPAEAPDEAEEASAGMQRVTPATVRLLTDLDLLSA
jgi:HK97 family phage prohead protease